VEKNSGSRRWVKKKKKLQKQKKHSGECNSHKKFVSILNPLWGGEKGNDTGPNHKNMTIVIDFGSKSVSRKRGGERPPFAVKRKKKRSPPIGR